MKRFLMAGLLVGVLAVSAFAGDSSTCGSPAPQPGDLPTGGAPNQFSSDALSALLSMLSVLV